MQGMLITGSLTLFSSLLVEVYVGPTIYLKMSLTLIHETHAFHL